jgi:hypothetical protein
VPADASLFGDDTSDESDLVAETDASALPDWQVEQLRSALDARGVRSMEDRQRLVGKLAGREVASLRELTWSEARTVSEALAADANANGRHQGSAWDQREEDTWIDRL